MKDHPLIRFLLDSFRLYGLLIRYIYLHIRYVMLHIELYLLKAAGAILIEAVNIYCCIKSLSKEDRVIFATCTAVSIYILALIMLIRM
jgi:hypothetical protein